MSLPLAGSAWAPSFGFSRTSLRFTAPGAEQLIVKNMGDVPCDMHFVCPAGIHLFSETGPRDGSLTVRPREAKEIPVWFRPRHMMRENAFLHFEFANEYFNSNLAVSTNFDFAATQALKQTQSRTNHG